MLIDQLRNFINVVLCGQLGRSFAQKQMLPLNKSLKKERLLPRIISVSLYFSTHLSKEKRKSLKQTLKMLVGEILQEHAGALWWKHAGMTLCTDGHIDQKLKRQQDVLLTPVYL